MAAQLVDQIARLRILVEGPQISEVSVRAVRLVCM
jgi:hypothetical protein